MGANSELHIEMQEAEINPNTEYFELIGRLQRKEESLSYSSLKAFAKSPRNFIAYKLKPKTEQTDSQKFGSLCDCLLTEPHNFDKLFCIVDTTPSTDNQRGFVADMVNGASAEEAFKNNYSRGKAEEIYSVFEHYISALKSGKCCITSKTKEEAEAIVENLKQSELVMQFLDGCNKFQNKREWQYAGWKFKGFTDAEGTNLIVDLKYSKDADPDNFEREIFNYDYFLQMGMYAASDEGFPECYFIVYDKSFNFSVIKLDPTLINYGIRKYQYLVTKLEQCISENRFTESYNFFDVQQRTVYKPKWVKGFDTDINTEDEY